jgi:hypothetical protein
MPRGQRCLGAFGGDRLVASRREAGSLAALVVDL